MEIDKRLYTPGPLTTRLAVKEAMLLDLGSRDALFVKTVASVRRRLLEVGEASVESGYEAVLMQGSGTFGLESAVGSLVPRGGKLLVLINGAYGRRVADIAAHLGIETHRLEFPENEVVDPEKVQKHLDELPGIDVVMVVHCETTTGILNPVDQIGSVVQAYGARYIVDAMSSFGGIPLVLEQNHIDALVSSANKCIEGVPGFSFILVRREYLEASAGWARSVSLDLHAQWQGLERNGQFRFTPPTHAILAFHQALLDLEAEGGVAGRYERYRANHSIIWEGGKKLGLIPYLQPDVQAPIITSFHYPESLAFSFEAFYERLGEKGFVIYPGKLTHADCFRIGNIGQLFESDMQELVDTMGQTLVEMGVEMTV